MKKRFVNVALCQRNSEGTPAHNLEASLEMVERAAKGRPDLDLIMLPELNDFMPVTTEIAYQNAQTIPGPYTDAFCALAKKLRCNLIPGSITEMGANGRTRNTTTFIDRDGVLQAKYEKVHLMSALGVDESKFSDAGKSLCLVDTDFARIGILQCYDIRFPEMARSLAVNGAEIIFCPACFPGGNPLPPRTDHWDLLVDAMALQNLTWVCAVNQYGKAGLDHPFGRSRVTNPWGAVIARANDCEDIVYATLDMQYEQDVRDSVGGLRNRRPDVYRL